MKQLSKEGNYKYINIADKIHKDILDKKDIDNNKILSERNLMKKYNVSRVTIRKALKLLEHDDIIYRQHGKGTFINEEKVIQPIDKSISFSKLAEKHGFIANTKLIESKIQLASNDDIDTLKIPRNNSRTVICISRKRYLNNSLVSFEVSHFRNDFAFLLDINLENKSIYKVIEEKGYKLKINTRSIEIIEADKNIAHQLQLTIGTPIILVSGTVIDQNGDVTNLVKEYLLASKFKFNF